MLHNTPMLLRFGGLLGVPVEVRHSTLLLVLVLLGVAGQAHLTWTAIVLAMVLASIYLHELGHAAGAFVQRVPVQRIVLHGGGGYCDHGRTGTTQGLELIVILGPLVNLALWSIGSLMAHAAWAQVDGVGTSGAAGQSWMNVAIYCGVFAKINFTLFLLNMLPVQPLDGGRLLHLYLLRQTSPRNALRAAGTVGLAFSLAWWPGMLFLYLSSGWILLFVPSLSRHLVMMRGEYPA